MHKRPTSATPSPEWRGENKICLSLADRIDTLLPQTQCRRCGYADCRAYAKAVAAGEAAINRCPPGGHETIQALAEITGQRIVPLDPTVGQFIPQTAAFIDEALCIGCTKCIQACPVDAIVGAPKLMHTVIEALCTGCELCVAPCPVDCIYMQPARGTTEGLAVPAAEPARAGYFRARYQARNARLARDQSEREAALHARPATGDDIVARRKAEIAAAMARVRAKRALRERQRT